MSGCDCMVKCHGLIIIFVSLIYHSSGMRGALTAELTDGQKSDSFSLVFLVFYAISTLLGYLMPNPLHTHTYTVIHTYMCMYIYDLLLISLLVTFSK